MDRSRGFTYDEGPGYQALALPYGGDAVRMLVVLPSAPLAPSSFAQYMDTTRFKEVVGALKPGLSGELRILVSASTARHRQPLRALGMGPASQPGAGFAGIPPSYGRSCFISDVTQKSRLEVDEKARPPPRPQRWPSHSPGE